MAQIKKSGLGRGLESVFTDNNISGNTSPVTLRVSQIQPRKNQPRKNFDEDALNELAASIAEHGIIQPIAVRATESGIYEIVAGERRWRASKIANPNANLSCSLLNINLVKSIIIRIYFFLQNSANI